MCVLLHIRREGRFSACCNHGRRKPVRFMGHGVERQHNARDFFYPRFGRCTLDQSGTKHIVERPVTTLVNGISFRMVGRRQHSLDSEGAQQFAPYFFHKFPTSVGQKAVGCTKVWNHMAEEGFTHRVCGVVARGNEDGVPRVAVHKTR